MIVILNTFLQFFIFDPNNYKDYIFYRTYYHNDDLSSMDIEQLQQAITNSKQSKKVESLDEDLKKK